MVRNWAFILLLLPALSFCGTTGKIAGVARDTETGEPLWGVNIYIPGTHLGGATNSAGYYFILNVPPGYHNLRAEMIGYRPVLVCEALVVTDQTSTVDFKLKQHVIDIGEELVIVAERPLIERDRTSKFSVMTGEEIHTLPVHSVEQVLSFQAGVTTDAQQQLHIRGGRTNEIAYTIDGISTRDPLFGGMGIPLSDDALQEMVVLSGTFNAEYGDAMSGVVNIVTREGGDRLEGGVEYTSQTLNSSPYRKKNALAHDKYEYSSQDVKDGFHLPFLGQVSGRVSGPLVKRLDFFLSGRYSNENSRLPFGYKLEREALGKVTYKMGRSKVFAAVQRGREYYQEYNHAWKYRYDHYPEGKRFFFRETAGMTYSPGPRLFFTLGGSHLRQEEILQVDEKTTEEYERGIATDLEFYTEGGGDYPLYRDSYTDTWLVKGDLTFQLTDHHQLKTGIEAERHEIFLNQMTQLLVGGPYQHSQFRYRPLEGCAYIQDKIEYDYLVLNLGLRYDYADPKAKMWSNIRDPSSEVDRSPKKTQLSPRIGLAHPVTDRTVLHFSYGHFFQNPPYYQQYNNLVLDPDSVVPYTLIGNPKVQAQKTVAFEVGVQQKLTKNFAFDAGLFYKDMTDLLATTSVRWRGLDYVVFDNADYGNVKGVDLTLRGWNDLLSGMLSYTYSVAKGNRSTPMEGFWNAYYQRPEVKREYYLDFDRTHDLAVNLRIKSPFKRGFLSGSGVTILVEVASGLPYTPYVAPTVTVEENSGRKPTTATVNLRFDKEFSFLGIGASFFMEATNLFDRINALSVYSRTGDPWDAGWGGLGTSPDAVKDPSNVGPRREVRAGCTISLD